MYRIDFTEQAKEDLSKLKRREPIAFKKARALLLELEKHPRVGTGQIEQLRHCKEETFSRRLDKKHRLVYRIYEESIKVLVLSSFGHYEDK